MSQRGQDLGTGGRIWRYWTRQSTLYHIEGYALERESENVRVSNETCLVIVDHVYRCRFDSANGCVMVDWTHVYDGPRPRLSLEIQIKVSEKLIVIRKAGLNSP
jgi:hypothetical protein